MATWNFHQLRQFLSKRAPTPLYLIFGEEHYLIHEALNLIRAKSLEKGVEDFNMDRFDASQVNSTQVRDAVITAPVASRQRLVIFKSVQKLKERDWEPLIPLIDNPVDHCVFVLVAEKIDKRKKYFKRLSRHGVCVELNPPYDNQIPSWIDSIASDEKVEFNKEAKLLLHQLVGSNLFEIKSEISKIKSYLGHHSQITEEGVLKVVSRSRVHSIFDLTHAIGRKDMSASVIILSTLLESGENAVAILSLVLRHIRILGFIKKAQSKGLTGQKLSTTVGVPHFFLGQYQQQSNVWAQDQIKDTIVLLHETDRELKSSPVSPRMWLENFIIKSCRLKSAKYEAQTEWRRGPLE